VLSRVLEKGQCVTIVSPVIHVKIVCD